MIRILLTAAAAVLVGVSVANARTVTCQFPQTGTVVITEGKYPMVSVSINGKKHVYTSGSYFIQPDEDDSLPAFGSQFGTKKWSVLETGEKGRCK